MTRYIYISRRLASCCAFIAGIAALTVTFNSYAQTPTQEKIQATLPGIICFLICEDGPFALSTPQTSIVVARDQAISPIRLASNNNQAISNCQNSPALPAGLTLALSTDQLACEITGTPTGLQSSQSYQISADSGMESSDITINIEITEGITVSGKISYDLVPTTDSAPSPRLDYNAISQQPVRGATVELLNDSNSVIQTTTTDMLGDYAFDLVQDAVVRVRVRAELLNTGGTATYDVKVVDNTNSGAIYTLTEAAASNASVNSVRNLNAGSGWDGAAYTGTRASGPFAILDSMYLSVTRFIEVDSNINLSPLTVNWSVNNVPVGGDLASGQIGTSFYSNSNLFILGAANSDTDEFDDHVMIHEWGHYFEDNLSRSDSIGGSHSGNDRLDMRLAFGEGFGNALSGMITDDPKYLDTLGQSQSLGFVINVEDNYNAIQRGWYNESSVQSLLYDFYDADDDGTDTTSLGLGPIYQVLVNEQKDSSALTSIFSFATALKANNAGASTNISALLDAQNIVGSSIDEYGTTETNNAGNATGVLPVYSSLTIGGGTQNVCTETQYGKPNKLSIFRYLRVTIASAGMYQIQASRTSSAYGDTDPDFQIFKDGSQLFVGQSAVLNQETQTFSLSPGEHIIVLHDFNARSGNGNGQACFNVSISVQ